jgi:hypothetical protein
MQGCEPNIRNLSRCIRRAGAVAGGLLLQATTWHELGDDPGGAPRKRASRYNAQPRAGVNYRLVCRRRRKGVTHPAAQSGLYARILTVETAGPSAGPPSMQVTEGTSLRAHDPAPARFAYFCRLCRR